MQLLMCVYGEQLNEKKKEIKQRNDGIRSIPQSENTYQEKQNITTPRGLTSLT
jgi:hypothetical protein